MSPRRHRGVVPFLVRHPTAPNLVLAIMMILGLAALLRLNVQFFPDFGIDAIVVEVGWDGATAEEVDVNIVQAVEPEIRFTDGVKRVVSQSSESGASITLEFEPGSDMQLALSQVEAAVAQVDTLPANAERPKIKRVLRYEPVTRLVLSGEVPESTLRALARSIRDDLLTRGVDKIEFTGLRQPEILVEIEPETLRRLNLTIAEVSSAIRQGSQDVPSGELSDGQRRLRTVAPLDTAEAVAALPLRTATDGSRVALGEIASVRETYNDDAVTVVRDGQPAIEMVVQRAPSANALRVAAAVDAYLTEIEGQLPPSVRLEQYDVVAALIQDRIRLLVENGLGGLIVVVAILYLLLNGRVAFWVAAGIPAAMLATMGVMLATGQSINMISLFGMIMAIGIVVDDAIVVGEHAEARFAAGLPPEEAAIVGASRMTQPVVSATLTTVAAFLPLVLVGGVIGEIMRAIPLVIVAVLLASLLECFLVLPSHLASAFRAEAKERARAGAGRFRRWFDARFDAFRDGPFRRAVAAAIGWRYTVLAGALALMILAIGMVVGGRLAFQFFDSPEPDRVFANIKMVAGSSRSQTEAMVRELERGLRAAEKRLVREGEAPPVAMVIGYVGRNIGFGGNFANATLGGLMVELHPGDSRRIRNGELLQAWREETIDLAGLENIVLREARGGPPGRDLDIRLTGQDLPSLKQAAVELSDILNAYPGVSNVGDDLHKGTPEIVLSLTQRGEALGFTGDTLGRQLREAVDGAIARRFARGEDEVEIRVRLPEERINRELVRDLPLRSPAGAEVSVAAAVDVSERATFSTIRREGGRREVAVTGEFDKDTTTLDQIIAALEKDGLVELTRRHGATHAFKGRAEEQADAFADMRLGTVLALAFIYIILAWVFGSYTRPLVVMAMIPLGFVGAVIGHMALDYQLSILSLMSLLGLAGIVVNDSIVLVSTIDERRAEAPGTDGIIQGTCDRLRAVILTSATTIGGLTPLLFETSLQAKFLIPMAVTIVFGLMVTTFMVLFVVPALIATQDDLARLFRRRRPSTVEV